MIFKILVSFVMLKKPSLMGGKKSIYKIHNSMEFTFNAHNYNTSCSFAI
jgi:hypothetical protein